MSTQIHPDSRSVPEPAARYTAPPRSSIVSRKTVKILPSNGSSFTAGNQISITIPPNSWLDTRGTYLSYLIKTSAGELSTNSQCWISRLRCSSSINNQTIIDIQNYNVLHAIMEKVTARKTYKENAGQILEGTNNNSASTTNLRRCIQLIGGLFDNDTFFPVKYVDGLQVDLWVESSDAVMGKVGGTTVTGVTVSVISMVCEFVDFDPTYTAIFEKRFLGENGGAVGIPYSFDTFTSSKTTINGTSASKVISENVRSLKSLFCVQQQTGDKTDTFRQARLSSVLYKLGNVYYPSQAISTTDGASEAFKEMQKALNVSGDMAYSIACTPAQWSDFTDIADQTDLTAGDYELWNNSFILGMNFERSEVAQSGANIHTNPLSIQLTYGADGSNTKNPATTAIDLISFAHYDAVLTLTSTDINIDY